MRRLFGFMLWIVSACFLGAPAVGAAEPAAPPEADAQRREIAAVFEGLRAAFEQRDADRVLSFYDEGAIVVTHSMGRGDVARFRQQLLGEFAALRELRAAYDVASLRVEADIATAKVVIAEKVVFQDGRAFDRNATFFYRLMKRGERWPIYLQSYREDFGVSNTHGAHAPAGP